jgi:hypothetical protein
MKTKLISALITLMLMFGGHATAEPRKLAIILECDTDLANILNMAQSKYEEVPFAQGKILVQIMMPTTGATQWTEAEMLMTVNPQDEKTFSILALFSNGHGCLLAPGQQFAPALGE